MVYSSSIILLYLTCLFIATPKMYIDFAETFRVSYLDWKSGGRGDSKP